MRVRATEIKPSPSSRWVLGSAITAGNGSTWWGDIVLFLGGSTNGQALWKSLITTLQPPPGSQPYWCAPRLSCSLGPCISISLAEQRHQAGALQKVIAPIALFHLLFSLSLQLYRAEKSSEISDVSNHPGCNVDWLRLHTEAGEGCLIQRYQADPPPPVSSSSEVLVLQPWWNACWDRH